MVEDYDSIIRNSVWNVVPRPEDKSVVSFRWVYKVKQAADGSVEKHKARFVACGLSQVEGVDYDETFAPVARYLSIRLMLALSTQTSWKIHQMDVKTMFLNGNIEEVVYIEQSEGFETFDRESHVCQLKRALYGLKQAPCAWYTRINSYFTRLGFTKGEADANLYHIMVEGKYANEIFRRFHMEKCKPMQTPLAGNWRKEAATSGEVVAATVYRQLVGSLMYLVNTRPDLCSAVNQLSQAMVQPTKLFWKVAKHVQRYLRCTSQYGLWYSRKEGVKLQGFTDADWVGSSSDWKSTSGGIFNLGSIAVFWYNRKQRSVVPSSAEVEYMADS
eukprot:PITA_33096